MLAVVAGVCLLIALLIGYSLGCQVGFDRGWRAAVGEIEAHHRERGARL